MTDAASCEEIKILVIDDEESMRDSCAQVLIRQGYQVQTAVNGEAGLEAIKQDRRDIVLVDLKMPKLSGMEVIEEMNRSAPDSVSIVITAYATVNSALDAVRQGAFDFLPKPFTPHELKAITARAVSHLSERRELKKMTECAGEAKLKLFNSWRGRVMPSVEKLEELLKELEVELISTPPAQGLAKSARDEINHLKSLIDSKL